MRKFLLILFLVSIYFLTENKSYSFNDNKYIHPIDEAETKCIANANEIDYVFCTQTASEAWDCEIKKYLKLLKEIMSIKDYKQIEKMNKEQNKSAHSQIKVINGFIGNKTGIIYQTEAVNNILNLKKQYALLLMSIYYNYNEEKEKDF